MEHVESREWTEMSDDMLHEIAKLLYCYDDYYRFRAVCKQWNKVLPQIPNRPWLVIPFDDKALETRVAEKKIHYVKLPEMQTSRLRGSCFGWLIAVGFDGKLRMLNPFTRKHKDLPPISTFPSIFDYNPDRENPYTVKDNKYFHADNNNSGREDYVYHDEDSNDDGEDDDNSSDQGDDPDDNSYDEGDDANENDDSNEDDDDLDGDFDDEDNDSDEGDIIYLGPIYGTFCVSNKFIQRTYITKITISCPPDDEYNEEEFMAIAIYGQYCRLAFCKHGDKKWTDIPKSQKDCDDDCDYDYEDAIFHQGKIYVIDGYTQIFVFDIKNPGTPVGGIIEIPKPHDLYFFARNWKLGYLIGCVDGGLLMVIRHLNFYQVQNIKFPGCNSPKFEIYKLEKGAKEWSRVFELKNYALLIGFNSSVSVPAHNVPNGWDNGIHYTDNILPTQSSGVVGGNDIGVFNFEDGKSTQLFPDITLLTPPPVWLL
ncbi:hypothetical protein Lal_00049966 [Lupinus albus]|uniref:KIB1-4 beta-propeller domain-containing protein n=1 Tax=Lupinus albus TaxID=3870 RepID=A0A6A4PL80_LUPAL|nr:hypothetical protein Lalb_Chr12g0197901 [Lupinus albus]KAE9602283.1 hypothetical protein Lalb_Chr12g0197921 [Lupinus albus]KAF1855119.1 hypothetical protein Lal_00004269 [Lupinus albus]KAF1867537.1 hypothetical protein Lal_00049966 [Lupinus albus]